jgi:cell division protein ZapB
VGIYKLQSIWQETMADPQLKALAVKINDLIQLCDQLDRENRMLKSEAVDWMDEREQLVEKTEVARSKVESMIVRLKTLEQDS